MAAVSIQITADTTSLTAKLAVAKAEFQNATTELRTLAQQAAAAGGAASSELSAGLARAAETSAVARAEVAALNTQLKEMTVSMGGFSGLKTSIEGAMAPLASLQASMSAFAPVMIAAFAGKEIVDGIEHTAELGANLLKLSEQTGVSVETLSGWHYGAEQVDVSAESMDASIKRLGRSMQEALRTPTSQAAEAFHAMGISQDFLRENSNNLQAVLYKMADAFHSHADGANADAIAQATLGRAGVEMIPWMRLGSQAIQERIDRQRELGGQITGPMAEAMREHLQAVRDMQTSWEGVEIQLTNLVLPSLTKLVQSLTKYRDLIVDVVKYGPILGSITYFGGGPSGAAPANAGANTQSTDTSGGAAGGLPKFSDLGGGKGPKEQHDYYAQWKEQLDQQLIDLQLFGQQAEAYELQYWQAKLAVAQAGGKNYQSATRTILSNIYQLESEEHRQALEAARRAAEDRKRIDDETFRSIKGNLEFERQAAAGYADQMIALDQKLVDVARQFYGEDSQNFRDAMRQKLTDLKAEIDQEMQLYKELVDGIGSSFSSMFKGLISGTQSVRQTMANFVGSILDSFINMAVKQTEDWVLQQIRQVLVTEQAQVQIVATAAGSAATTAIKTAAAAEGRAVDAAASSAQVTGDAAKAAAGAYQAVVGIPIIGPILAPIAAATAYGAVLAFDIFSADKGMDVGAGVNPITQLHAREMVLPANLADRVRQVTEPSGDINLHFSPTIHAPQNSDIVELADRQARQFMTWIQARVRDGSLKFT